MSVRLVLIAMLAGAVPACTGEIVVDGRGEDGADAGDEDTPPDPDPDPDPVMVTIDGPDVLPHVQVFADAACGAVGACTVSTYNGHHPTAARATDTLVSDAYGSFPSDDNALGDALAEFALAHQAEYGIWYVIWRQRYNDGAGWDPMEDRGSITQNHYDHVHISFDEIGP